MNRSVLISETTREERIRIVSDGLSWCGDASCDMCAGCSLGAGSLDAMYQPYIDGEMELAEVNRRAAATRYVRG